jgi:hypothetical protein
MSIAQKGLKKVHDGILKAISIELYEEGLLFKITRAIFGSHPMCYKISQSIINFNFIFCD